jgi:4'-phosphopantetheinyl transferase
VIQQNNGMPMSLAPGDVQVWCRPTDSLGDVDIAAAVALLSPDEHARYTRFRFARDQRDYATAHALLRTSLSKYAAVAPESWRFQEAPGGKPSLVPGDGMPRLSFNLSHTHGLVACAIAIDADVGIDVESLDRTVGDGVARRYFSARENDDLRQCASEWLRTRRFIELWTLKEAYIKAIGKGLSHPLDTIVFDVADRDAIVFLPPPDVDAAAWRFFLCAPTEHHRLAVAVKHDRDVVPRIRMMPDAASHVGPI